MAKFMIQGSYTAEAWAAQISNPSDRMSAVSDMMASIGVTFEHSWYSFGDHDFVIIAEGPGNTEAAAAALAAVAGGAVKSLKTTPLLTTDEMIEVLKTASKVQYRTPTAG
jgi:uncharacterized protein with GYD domain